MTDQEISNLTDSQINEAVAVKLGWRHDYWLGSGLRLNIKFWFRPGRSLPDSIPDYCHSIAAAWEIVDSLAMENERKGCGPILSLTHDGQWHFRIGAMSPTLGDDSNVAQADTAPKAICLAFLKLETVEPLK